MRVDHGIFGKPVCLGHYTLGLSCRAPEASFPPARLRRQEQRVVRKRISYERGREMETERQGGRDRQTDGGEGS